MPSATITDAATNLGAIKNRIGLQQDFVKTLTDSLDRGIGQLVDADMNAELTRLQALQTQQQLGIQALSIANSGSQSILSLFRRLINVALITTTAVTEMVAAVSAM